MNNLSQKFWTHTINNDTIIITSDYQLTALSIVLKSGAGTYSGSVRANNVPSTAIDLEVGQPITVFADSNNPIDGLTITTTGILNLIGKP